VIAIDVHERSAAKQGTPPLWINWTGVRDRLQTLGELWAKAEAESIEETGTVQGGAEAEAANQLKSWLIEVFISSFLLDFLLPVFTRVLS
jgi:hypothetical protein